MAIDVGAELVGIAYAMERQTQVLNSISEQLSEIRDLMPPRRKPVSDPQWADTPVGNAVLCFLLFLGLGLAYAAVSR